ncbi:MAG: hypothetical protein GXP06_07670 [Alphaproteobacteria bacterium]|nr:hypothetical protein [Alphaproteobacteria bacterium]
MSPYAPNPTPGAEDGAASLTAGLLARKGEAAPAVDAEAHAGVDIAKLNLKPAREAPRAVSQKAIETLYPMNANSAAAAAAPTPYPQDRADQPPANWTIPPRVRSRLVRRNLRRETAIEGDRRATVTFRMPAKDFVRLRFASRDFEMSCQSIILDALGAYLDGNDVEPVSEDVCKTEVEKLIQSLAKARGR